MIENRAISSIRSRMDKGENSFIYYGEYVNDWFLYDLYNGVMSLKETYKRYFLCEDNCDYYVWLKNNQLEVYHKEGDKIALTDELVVGHINKKSFLAGCERKRPTPKAEDADKNEQDEDETKSNAEEQANNVGSRDKAAFKKVVSFCRNHPSVRVAFFFEAFDWTTGMFRSSNDDELYIIEDMLELKKNNNCIVIMTISDVELLKRYNIKTDAKNVEMLGSPSVDEIWRAFLRRYMRKYKERRKFSTNEFSKLYLIAESVGSGDRSLKEAIRIFDRVMAQSKGKIEPENFNDAIDKIIEEKVSFEDVILNEETKKDIIQRVDDFLKADDTSKGSKGLILTGPPGTGKTFMVKALANEKNCYFMSPSLADLKGEYIGHTSAKVKRVFQQARANAPTILFIDEADTVFTARDLYRDSDSFAKDMVNQFLVEMDGLCTGDSKVFVIAATNRINTLDPAIRSRLGTPIDIPLPSKNHRKQLFANQLRSKDVERFKRCIFFDSFIDKTNRMSGRDIKNFVTSLDTEAKKDFKKLTDYNDEEDIRRLFDKALKNYEDEMISKLQDELKIFIRRPTKGLGYDSIIGCDNVKKAINRQMRMFDPAERQRAKEYNIKPKRGILLYGPPGNGKSRLAEAAASEKNLLFMKVTGDIVTKSSLNEISQVLIRIFNSAIQLSELCTEQNGVLLFFDEFDAFASKEVLDSRIRGTLLTQLDDQNTMRNPTTRVLLVAATNFLEKLDEAAIRSGRIDEKVKMDNPNQTEARLMIKSFCERNDHVEVPSDDTAQYAYEQYVRVAEERAAADIISKNRFDWIMNGNKANDLNQVMQEQIKGLIHPSGADLNSFVDRLIEYVYDNTDPRSTEKLRITETAIDEVCSTMNGEID